MDTVKHVANATTSTKMRMQMATVSEMMSITAPTTRLKSRFMRR